MAKNNKAVVVVRPRAALTSEINRLIGRKCWKASFTYGGELCLHFGRRLSYDSPVLKGKKRGEWQLRTRATAWEVVTPTGSFSSLRGSEAELEQRLECLVERKVKSVDLTNPAVLTIEFVGKILFRITPTSDDARTRLAFWELGMPQHRVASFEPTSGLSIRASNVPKTGHATRHPVRRRA